MHAFLPRTNPTEPQYVGTILVHGFQENPICGSNVAGEGIRVVPEIPAYSNNQRLLSARNCRKHLAPFIPGSFLWCKVSLKPQWRHSREWWDMAGENSSGAEHEVTHITPRETNVIGQPSGICYRKPFMACTSFEPSPLLEGPGNSVTAWNPTGANAEPWQEMPAVNVVTQSGI